MVGQEVFGWHADEMARNHYWRDIEVYSTSDAPGKPLVPDWRATGITRGL